MLQSMENVILNTLFHPLLVERVIIGQKWTGEEDQELERGVLKELQALERRKRTRT